MGFILCALRFEEAIGQKKLRSNAEFFVFGAFILQPQNFAMPVPS